MAVTVSSLTVTPTWSSKRLTIDGTASVRESVALRIVGCGTDTSVVFKLSSENGRVDYAKFPNADTDAWTVDGSDLIGTLNLNTDLLVAAFAPLCPEDRMDLVCTVASAANSNLYAIGHKQIGNWMEDTDDPVAYRTPLADAVDELDDGLTALRNSFTSHAHDGASSVRIPHSALLEIGANSHEAIDAALITLSSGVSANASNIVSLTSTVEQLVTGTLKVNSFLSVAALTESTATVKKLDARVNELLVILKGMK